MKKQITKSYLEYLGVINVTEDGKVFTSNGELKPHTNNMGYLYIRLYDAEKYKSVPKDKRNTGSGQVTILVHHAVYAWFHGEVPYDKEIHHRDCDPLNNSIDNLEALSHEEHVLAHKALRKPRKPVEITAELKCMLNKPRSYYEERLASLEATEDKTRIVQNQIWRYKCYLNYYDANIEEYTKAQNELARDLKLLKEWKKLFKKHKNTNMCRQLTTVIKDWNKYSTEQKEHVFDTLGKTFGDTEIAHRHFGGNLQ